MTHSRGKGSLYGWSPVYQDWIWPKKEIVAITTVTLSKTLAANFS